MSWTTTSLTLIFLLTRLLCRYLAFRKPQLDDLLVILAWLFLLAFSTTWQIKISILYWQFAIVSGETAPTVGFVAAYATFMPFIAVWNILFYGCLWSIKFSFLVFFRALDQNTGKKHAWWWSVFGLTGLGLVVCVGDIPWDCSVAPIGFIMGK